MADVCVFYARADASDIPPGVERLLADLQVWWDRKIIHGDYRTAIEGALATAGCVVPIWSRAALASQTLHDELNRARTRQVPILPLRIHNVEAPLGFGVEHATNVIGWDGEGTHPELEDFVSRVRAALVGRRRLARPGSLFEGRDMPLPQFFFSVSSYETKLEPQVALQALDLFKAQTILVSAYDTLPSVRATGEKRKQENAACAKIAQHLDSCRSRGGLVLLDSGKYEKTRKSDSGWQYARFKKAVRQSPHDFVLAFDTLNPSGHATTIVTNIVDDCVRDAEETESSVVPIIHVPQKSNGEYRSELLPEIAVGVAGVLSPPMIAIPERELGSGIFARMATLVAVRRSLSSLYRYVPIHVLGTGYPTSVALFAAAGADSFDGLEWCRFVLDAESGTLHHFQHFDFYKYQAQLATSGVTRAALEDGRVNYAARTVFHNLDAYTTWLSELRAALSDERRLTAFLASLLPDGAMEQVLELLPEKD